MKTRRIINGIFLAILLALANFSTAFALPPLPDSFYGTVKINGANLLPGTQVTAWCGGVQYAYSNYQLYDGDTVYALNMPGDDPSTPLVIEGCANPAPPAPPATVTFYVGGVKADQTAPWISESNTNLDLTVTCYALTLGHMGQGSDPVASPANSPDCSAGKYVTGESINLSGAAPSGGWQIASWTGTNNDASTDSTNTVVMPASSHTAKVNYTALPNHTVTFNSNGGSGSMSPQTANVPTALTLNAFTRTGYTFSGWNTQSGGGGTAYTNGASYNFSTDITLYAQWSINSYTVTYNGNGNSGGSAPVDASSPYPYGSTVTVLSAGSLVKTGNSFSGWNTAANGSGTSYNPAATFTLGADSVILYAQWSINSFSVTFLANGGTGTMNPQSGNYNTTAPLTLNAFTRTGYTFSGWNTQSGGGGIAYANGANYTFTASITLYAQWSINSYTVTFLANGGTGSMDPQSGSYNTTAPLTLNTFTRTGYTFSGWNTQSGGGGSAYADGANYTFTASISLYAQWSINSYTVTFLANGGAGTMNPQSGNYNTTAPLTLNAFTRTGYTFSGWNTQSGGGGIAYANGANYTFTASITLYAQWSINSYTVTYNGNGNSGGSAPVDPSSPYPYGSTVTVLSAGSLVKTGYSFSGWNTAANGLGTSYNPAATFTLGAANVILYAQWTALPMHTVTFNGNGGTGTMSPQTANVPTALTLNTFTRSGYNYAGWNTAANGTGTAYGNGAIYSFSADLTLYAQWSTLPNHTVTFNSNGGTGTMSQQIANVPTALTLNTFTRTGYSFSGWNTQSGGGGSAYADGAVYSFTADLTLYAQWTALPNHTVTFNANGGTGSMSNQTANIPTALTLNTFTRTGYSFSGWNTLANGTGTSYADGAIYSFSANVTLYAQWSINSYTVTFNANGGTGTMNPQTGNYNTTAPLTLNAFTRTGYTFSGWNTQAGGGGTAYANGANYTFTASISLYAQWSINSYTVTFNANGGTGTMNPQTGNYNTTAPLTLNAFTRTGYTFSGWNTQAGGGGTAYANGANYTFTVSVTLYAQWTTLPMHTVTFNSNGGSGSMSNQTANVPTALTLNAFTRSGYNFAGWNTLAYGTGTAYANGAIYSFSADVTLYAQWSTLPNHTVTFNSNGGTGTMSPQIADVPTALTLNTFTLTGSAFSGWNTLANGTGTFFADGAVYSFAADITLYAQWMPLPPGAFGKINPLSGTTSVATNPTLSWGTSSGASSYEYCYATSTGCTSWSSAGTNTSVGLSGLSNGQIYYWQVRAVNLGGTTLANTGTYWSFTTISVNHAPIANPQSITTSENTPKAITLTGSDPDGDTLTYSIVAGPSKGILSGTAPALTYTPAANFSGSDSFTFKVNDGTVDSLPATVSITVTAANNPPIITEGDSISVSMSANGSPNPFRLTLHATDVDGDTLTWSILTQAGHGVASAGGTGLSKVITYTPIFHYKGSDSFIVKVSDGKGGTDVITVNVTIDEIVLLPLIHNDSIIY